ncbi:FCD domain-containing protein [uncultured Pseudacidovorax sp.]|uniref:FCD domain-containing protein n=1 Tax=uncultured Pseudacidovorax sp. TaxID=679313 RepID=UPI0025F31822|nr:FCD domain-containing protein [uncultured Pseudacidovorax sp.]
MEDLTALRALVEEAAIRQAIARGGDVWEAGIVAAFHRLELQLRRKMDRFSGADEEAIRAYDQVHRAFHAAFFAGGVVSERLVALHCNLYDQAFRYRKTLHDKPYSPEQVLSVHRQLMEVVLSRDADAAVEALCAHLRSTRHATARFLARRSDAA